MSTINPISIENAQSPVKETLAAVKAKVGSLPNVFAVMANAPAALNGYLALSEALGKGKLPTNYREMIGIAIASKNASAYCLAAHSLFGKKADMQTNDLTLAQSGKSSDPKAQAVLDLALELNRTHGKGAAAAAAKARTAGLTEEEILEVAANVAVNIMTNSINGLAETEVDFPKVQLSNAA
jgi:uncharacterized peroxidase-related enzyme